MNTLKSDEFMRHIILVLFFIFIITPYGLCKADDIPDKVMVTINGIEEVNNVCLDCMGFPYYTSGYIQNGTYILTINNNPPYNTSCVWDCNIDAYSQQCAYPEPGYDEWDRCIWFIIHEPMYLNYAEGAKIYLYQFSCSGCPQFGLEIKGDTRGGARYFSQGYNAESGYLSISSIDNIYSPDTNLCDHTPLGRWVWYGGYCGTASITELHTIPPVCLCKDDWNFHGFAIFANNWGNLYNLSDLKYFSIRWLEDPNEE
jgi:hypothetical protein